MMEKPRTLLLIVWPPQKLKDVLLSLTEDLNERNYRAAPFILQVIKIPDNQ